MGSHRSLPSGDGLSSAMPAVQGIARSGGARTIAFQTGRSQMRSLCAARRGNLFGSRWVLLLSTIQQNNGSASRQMSHSGSVMRRVSRVRRGPAARRKAWRKAPYHHTRHGPPWIHTLALRILAVAWRSPPKVGRCGPGAERDRVGRMGCPSSLSHHRTCGSASGGSSRNVH